MYKESVGHLRALWLFVVVKVAKGDKVQLLGLMCDERPFLPVAAGLHLKTFFFFFLGIPSQRV